MKISRIRCGACLSAALMVSWVASARAVPPVVKDEGKFFSPEAVRKADEGIKEIARKSGRDLYVDTVPSVPAEDAAKVKGMSSQDREKYFYDWATRRANDAVVNGIYILVCKDPRHLQVLVTPQARSAFDRQTRDRVLQVLLAKFRESHFDEGLLDAVRFVQERVGAAKEKN